MSTFPNSPQLVRGGLVLLDPSSGAVQRIITLQYNPDTLTRTIQAQTIGADGSDRVEPMRFKSPPVETIKLDAEIDATDQLEFPDQNPTAAQSGIHPQLAALETIAGPTSSQLQTNNTLQSVGTLEILPMEAPLCVFVWSRNRVVPVKLTEFSITEEAFDPALNPIRAKVSLGLRVLTVNDLGFSEKGGSLYMSYLQSKEQLATKNTSGGFNALGIGGLP